MKKLFSSSLLPVCVFFFLSHGTAAACAACYGDTTGSRMGNAVEIGLFSMLALMLVVLAALGSFFLYLAHRAKHPLPDYSELLNDEHSSFES